MAWPSSPADNQTVTINGIVYIYSLTDNVWNRLGLGTTNSVTDSFTITDLTVTQSTYLGSAANVYIGGSGPGLYLSGDDSGGLTWRAPGAASLVSNGTSNLYVPSSDNITISVSGIPNTVVFTSTGVNIAGSSNISSNLTVAGNLTANKLISTISSGTAPLTVTSNTRVANLNVDRANLSDYSGVSRKTSGVYYPTLVSGNTTNNYAIGVNPNISFDTTTSILNSKNITINNNANVDNLIATSNVITSNLSVSSTANLMGASILLGSNANVKLTGGTTGQYLQTDGAGNLAWSNVSLSIINNGSSNVNVASSGNIVVSAIGNNTLTITSTGVNVVGYINVIGNIISTGNISVPGNIEASILTSNIATGTAPISVTSTTRVDNLNVARANVSDYVSVTNTNSGNIYVAFANGSATGNYALQSNTAIYANITSGNLYATNFIGNIIGNVTGSIATASTVSASSQPNITNIGTLINLTSNGVVNFTTASNVSLGSNSNLKITGGSSGQYLQTNGSGGLTWASVNSNGINNVNSNVSIPVANGNINNYVNSNLTFVVTSTGANIIGYANVNGNVTSTGNIDATGAINASVFTSNISSGTAPLNIISTTRVSNLNVARANISDYTSVTTASTGNMYFTFADANNTSNYTLYSNTAIYANITSGYIYAANFVGNGGQLTGVTATTADTATTANTVKFSAQPNITSVGTLLDTLMGSSNSFTGGNLVSATYLTGTLTTISQPNITSIGNLTSLKVTGMATFVSSQDTTVSSSPASGVINYDIYNGVVFDVTPTANWTANIGNVPTTNNRTTIVTFIITQGTIAYVPNVFQISGSTFTVKWAGGTPPIGSASKVDVISYSMVRSNIGGWTVLGQSATYS